MRKGILFVVTAPSGAGKTTLCDMVLEAVQGLEYSVSVTTRPPREGEENGRDYHFVDRAEFERRLAAGEFLEHAVVYDNYYGTRRATVEEALSKGSDLILDIDVKGALQIKEKRYPAVFIYIVPPSMEELERRLRGRATDSEKVIRKRLSLARDEMRYIGEYDYLVVNDDLDAAFDDLRAVILAERRRVERNEDEIRRIAG